MCVTCETHRGDVSGPELDGAKQAEDDDDDVDEVGQDGSPLVAQEVDHLALQHADLVEDRRRNSSSTRNHKIGMEIYSSSSARCQLCCKTLLLFSLSLFFWTFLNFTPSIT